MWIMLKCHMYHFKEANKLDYNWLKQEIIDYAYSIGIDSIGFTTADPFDELKKKLEDYHANGYASGFEESDISLRTEPKLSLPTARSIIAIALDIRISLKVRLKVSEVIAEVCLLVPLGARLSLYYA